MKVIQGQFGEQETVPAVKELLQLVLDDYSEGAESVVILVQQEDGDTHSISNLPVSAQIMFMEAIKLSYLWEN